MYIYFLFNIPRTKKTCADLRPRVRNHYRAHKLSFWLHLVPDYQKNSEGTSAVSIHHEINMFHGMMHPGQQNLSSKLSVIHPTIFASGLHDPPAVGLSTKTRHNSSSSSMDSPGSGKKRSGASSSNKGRTKGAPPSKELPDERHKQQDSGETKKIMYDAAQNKKGFVNGDSRVGCSTF